MTLSRPEPTLTGGDFQCRHCRLLAGSSPSLPDGSNPSAAIVQSASDVQCSRLLKTTLVAAVAFELSAVGPRFPFLQIAGMALAFGLFAAVYHLALMLLVRD